MQKFNLERGRSWNVVFFDDNQIRKVNVALHRRNRSRIQNDQKIRIEASDEGGERVVVGLVSRIGLDLVEEESVDFVPLQVRFDVGLNGC